MSLRWARDSLLASLVLAALVSLYGIGRINQATPRGMGLIGDSFFYVTGAENIAAGRGFGRLRGDDSFAPTTHYPPGYSLVMAGPQVVGVDKLESARWINLGAFGVSIFSLALLLRKASGSNLAPAIALPLVGMSPVLLTIHSWVMSEAVFLALSLIALLTLAYFLDSQRRRWLLLSAVAAGSAYLTRYVGIATAGAIFVALLAQTSAVRRRVSDAALFASIAILPMLAWFARNAALTGNLANRDVLWNPVGYIHLRALGLNLLSWFGPLEGLRGRLLAFTVLAVMGVLVAIAVLDLARAGSLRWRGSLEGVLVTSILLYLGSLAVSLSLFDAFTPINERIMAPVFVYSMALLALLASYGWARWGTPAKVVLVIGLATVGVWNTIDQAQLADELHDQVLGIADPAIQEQELVRAVRSLPDVPIVSNGLSTLYFWADRYSFALPVRVDVESGAARADFAEDLQRLHQRFRDEDAVLILFHPDGLAPEYATVEELTKGLTRVGQFPEGDIYRFEGSQGTSGS